MSDEERKKRLFLTLFQREYDYVHRSLRRFGVFESDIEDVAHELFMAVYRKLEELDDARPAKPWLLAFAARFAADYRRLARHRATEDDATLESLPSDRTPEEEVSRAEGRSLALRALDQLSIDIKSVFVAYELDDIPMKDIAQALAIPEKTAYSRLRLAREQFAAACAAIRGRT